MAFVVAGLESPKPPTVADEVPPNLKAGAELLVAPVKLKPVVDAVVVLPNKPPPKPNKKENLSVYEHLRS